MTFTSKCDIIYISKEKRNGDGKMDKKKFVDEVMINIDQDSHIDWYFEEYEDIVTDEVIDSVVEAFSKYLKRRYGKKND